MKLRKSNVLFFVAAALIGAAIVYSGFRPKPVDADIREVWMHSENYIGKSVRVSGTLKRFLEGQPKDHYALESKDLFRIGIEAPGLVKLVGREVTAEGKVVFDETKGLRLLASSVDVR